MNPFCNYAPNSVPKLCNYHGLVTTPLKSYIDLFSLYFPTLNYNYLYDPSIRLVTFPFQPKHKRFKKLPASYDWMAISNEMHINSLNQYQTMFLKELPSFCQIPWPLSFTVPQHTAHSMTGTHRDLRVSGMTNHFLEKPARCILEYKKENAKETYVNTGMHHAVQREMIEYVRIIK